MLKRGFVVVFWALLLFGSQSLLAGLPVYQGVKPVPSRGGENTEAQLPPLSPADKCCDREINAQRDRDPHGMSPQEVQALVKRVLRKPTAPPQPPTDGDGSR